MKQNASQIIESNGANELKDSFKQMRLQLGDQVTHAKFEAFAISKEPDLDCEKGKKKIKDVYYGRSSSLMLLFILEAYEKQHLTV